MNKNIAAWLANNTKLSINQIAKFCGLHPLEVNQFKKSNSIVQSNPVNFLLLTEEEIKRCENDQSLNLVKNNDINTSLKKTRTIAKKSELVNAVKWMVESYPKMPAKNISTFLDTTLKLVKSIQDKSYKDIDSIIAKHPVMLGLCSHEELDKVTFNFE